MAEVRSLTITRVLMILVVVLLLCSCRSTSGTEHDQIVTSSIDLAEAYVDRGEYRTALEVYDRALLEADDYRLYYNKSIVLSYIGDYEGAADICATAFLSYRYILSFKEAQAAYLKALEEGNAAYAVYIELLDLNPYDRAARNDYIELLLEDENYDEAYRQAQILWNQGYKDKTTVEYLNLVHPDIWERMRSQFDD